MARTATVTPARKSKAEEKLAALAKARNQAELDAVKKRRTLFKGMLRAFDAGVTYDELSNITGLTTVRVAQILRDERKEQNGK